MKTARSIWVVLIIVACLAAATYYSRRTGTRKTDNLPDRHVEIPPLTEGYGATARPDAA